MELMTEHLGKGFILILVLSLPCVLTAASIGLVVGILQAVTQVQEQTIAAAPKIIFVFMVLILGGGIMINVTSEYVRESVKIAFDEIPHDGVFLMPPQDQGEAHKRAREFFRQQASGKKPMSTSSNTPLLDSQKADGTTRVIKQNSTQQTPLGVGERMSLEKKNGNR